MNKCKIVLAVAVLAAAACEATNHEREAAYYNTAAVCEAEVLARPRIGAGQLQDRVDSDRFVDCMIAHGVDGRTMYEQWKKAQMKFATKAF
jgi:hypothetical protein